MFGGTEIFIIHTNSIAFLLSFQYISNMAKSVNRSDFMVKIKAKGIAVFSSRDIEVLFKVSKVAATFLLHRYSKQGFILQARQGLYVFPDAVPPETYLANVLYGPSYISGEFALSYHGIIPETVYEITSVTTKSTRRFEALGKVYSYRRIKQSAFAGYSVEKQGKFAFYLADPEKAFVDTLYYRVIFGKQPISRFNREKINKRKALSYAGLFRNRKLISALNEALA